MVSATWGGAILDRASKKASLKIWHLICDLNEEAESAMQKARETVNQVDRKASQSPEGEKKVDMFDKHKEGMSLPAGNSGEVVWENTVDSSQGHFSESEFDSKYNNKPLEDFKDRWSRDG